MSRYLPGGIVSILVLGLAGCGSAVGPRAAGAFSAANQAQAHSPQSPLPPKAESTNRPLELQGPDLSIISSNRFPHGQPKSRTTIVVDIDDTLCTTDYSCVILGVGSDNSRPFDCAAKTLHELAKKYNIVYLSARPSLVAHRTQRWLKANGFPDGQVLGSRNLIDFVAQTDFKKKTLARLQRQHGNLLIGIGDRPRDAEAYRANQMLPIVVNPCRGGKFHSNDLVFNDWKSVERFFQANEKALQDPTSLAENIRKGQLRVTLPG